MAQISYMNIPEKVSWQTLQQTSSKGILQIIRSRNEQFFDQQLALRLIPQAHHEAIIIAALSELWDTRKNTPVENHVDRYVRTLVNKHARTYIEKNILWWYEQLDKEELRAPGSKLMLQKVVFNADELL